LPEDKITDNTDHVSINVSIHATISVATWWRF